MNILQKITDLLKFTSIKNFNENSTTYKKEDLRILVLDSNNELVGIKISDISSGDTLQDLQSVLDTGKTAIVDGGKSYVRMLEGTPYNRQVYMEVNNGLTGSSYQDSFMFMQNDYVEIQNNANRLTADLNMYEGRFTFTQMNRTFSPTRYTRLMFREPLSNLVNIYLPAPSVSGDYDIALTTDLIPTINIVPDGNFIIPDGTDTKMLTFTDADPQTVTLPAIADAVGSIYFITNDSSGDLTLVSKLGGNDIWDSRILVNNKMIASGTILRVINDSVTYKIL